MTHMTSNFGLETPQTWTLNAVETLLNQGQTCKVSKLSISTRLGWFSAFAFAGWWLSVKSVPLGQNALRFRLTRHNLNIKVAIGSTHLTEDQMIIVEVWTYSSGRTVHLPQRPNGNHVRYWREYVLSRRKQLDNWTSRDSRLQQGLVTYI